MKQHLASYKTSSPDRYAILRANARENRKNATLAEQYLWEHLRNGVMGVEFLRQQQEDDAIREKDLEQMGFHIMRFTNEEVLYDINNELQQIEEYFHE